MYKYDKVWQENDGTIYFHADDNGLGMQTILAGPCNGEKPILCGWNEDEIVYVPVPSEKRKFKKINACHLIEIPWDM